MPSKLRKSPPVCLGISIVKLFVSRLRIYRHHIGTSVRMEDGENFTIFRHISTHPLKENQTTTVFIVRFKFARLSHKANKIVSIIPMLLITGFPGFDTKMYAVNIENGFWQGMYQWKTKEYLEDYKKSFVYYMMNKRAISESLSSMDIEGQKLIDFIDKNKIQ